MRLCIAGLFLDVSVDASVAQALPNLLPFVVPECDGQVVVTRILTGQYISSEESSPTFVSQSDEKLIRVWLKPDDGFRPTVNGNPYRQIGYRHPAIHTLVSMISL